MPNWLFFPLIGFGALKFFGVVGYGIYRWGYEAGSRDSREVGEQLERILHDEPPDRCCGPASLPPIP